MLHARLSFYLDCPAEAGMIPGKGKFLFLFLFPWLCAVPLARGDFYHDIRHLQQRWAEVNYQLQGKTRLAAFSQLIDDAQSVAQDNPSSAQIWIWNGIIQSSYAGARGRFLGRAPARHARVALEQALELDPYAMDGIAYAYLGDLYGRTLPWPLSFGDDQEAETLFRQALEINPDGIDTNYLYGNFLVKEKRYDEARHYLLQAQHAPARQGRILADNGRQEEIRTALAAIPGH